MFAKAVGIAAFAVLPSLSHAATYRLTQSPIFDSSPYGYAGTITTDGTTGLVASTQFITSWSITVFTPAASDAVASELLTPANSTVALNLAGTLGLSVTPTSLHMPPAAGVPLATLAFATPDDATRLLFTNRSTNEDGLGGGAAVFDPSESNSALGVVLPTVPLATAIPEPTSLILLGLLIVGEYARQRVLRSVPRTITSATTMPRPGCHAQDVRST